MKDSHIITGFIILGAAVINLYLSPPAPRSSQTADTSTTQTAVVSQTASADESCEDATSPLVQAVAPPCPVMDMKVTTRKHKSVYNGKTYYFCCASCIPKFDLDPARYL